MAEFDGYPGRETRAGAWVEPIAIVLRIGAVIALSLLLFLITFLGYLTVPLGVLTAFLLAYSVWSGRRSRRRRS